MSRTARYEKGVSDTLARLFPIMCDVCGVREAVTSRRVGEDLGNMVELSVCEDHR